MAYIFDPISNTYIDDEDQSLGNKLALLDPDLEDAIRQIGEKYGPDTIKTLDQLPENKPAEVEQTEQFNRFNRMYEDGGMVRQEFDRGGVAKVKAYVESLPKNTVITRKLIQDFIDANNIDVNFQNLFTKSRTGYVGNFVKDKSIKVDPSYAASFGDTKKYKKAKDLSLIHI